MCTKSGQRKVTNEKWRGVLSTPLSVNQVCIRLNELIIVISKSTRTAHTYYQMNWMPGPILNYFTQPSHSATITDGK